VIRTQQGHRYQCSKGALQDNLYITYTWWSVAKANGNEQAEKNLDMVTGKMSKEQIGKTRSLSIEIYKRMKLRTHLSRSNGYRQLGMFDESILILEDIPFDEDQWHPLVVENGYSFMTRCVIS